MYDAPQTLISFGTFDFGGGSDETFAIPMRKGKGFRLIDYGIMGITEVLNGDTLDPQVSVGTVADPDAYGDEFTVSTANGADNTTYSVLQAYRMDEAGYTTLMVNPTIPAGAVPVIKCLAATGANLTGMGIPFVLVVYDL